jgi:hypothetical protein
LDIQHNVVDRNDALQVTLVIYNGQATDSIVLHALKSFVDVIVRVAGEMFSRRNLPDGNLSCTPVPRSQGNTDVTIGNDACYSTGLIEHWKGPTIVLPQERNRLS